MKTAQTEAAFRKFLTICLDFLGQAYEVSGHTGAAEMIQADLVEAGQGDTPREYVGRIARRVIQITDLPQ